MRVNDDSIFIFTLNNLDTVLSQTQMTWVVVVVTYSGVSVFSGAAGVRAYLIFLCRPACGPHKLHNGHKNSYYEPTYQHHEDSSDVLQPQTWKKTWECNTERVQHRKFWSQYYRSWLLLLSMVYSYIAYISWSDFIIYIFIVFFS